MIFNKKEIAENIFYVGVNDRLKEKFENLIPIPYGVSYNSYLVKGEKTALIDSVDASMSDLFVEKLHSALDKGETIDYLIINHIEPDHSGAIRFLRQFFPKMTIVGNKKTLNMLDGYYGILDNTLLVKQGDELDLGTHRLTFHLTPFVHWPETMMTYETTTQTLFSGDCFGAFGTLDGGVIDTEINTKKYWDEMYRYYANVMGKYGTSVQKALQKINKLEIKSICSTHGPVWKNEKDKMLDIYDKISKQEGEKGVVIVYSSMYGNTEQIAEAVAEGIVKEGIKDVIVHNVSKSNHADILKDIVKYKGLVIGSTTYNNDFHPEIKSLVSKIENTEVKEKVFGYFSSCSWANVVDKKLKEFAEKMKWETVEVSINEKMSMKQENYEKALLMGKIIAQTINK